MNIKTPQAKAFAQLDEMLSEEDKKKMAIIVEGNQQSSATKMIW